jgi:hypothetical protein
VSARSLAPLALVGSLAALGAAGLVSPAARRAALLELAAYAGAAAAFGILSASGRGESIQLVPRVVTAFGVLHAGYGLGMLRGWLRGGSG